MKGEVNTHGDKRFLPFWMDCGLFWGNGGILRF